MAIRATSACPTTLRAQIRLRPSIPTTTKDPCHSRLGPLLSLIMSTLPPSSPRLPSPPPPAEIQLGPKSPGLGTTASRQAQEMEQTIADANAKRRIHPGTKAENMAAGPPLIPLSEVRSQMRRLLPSRLLTSNCSSSPPSSSRSTWPLCIITTLCPTPSPLLDRRPRSLRPPRRVLIVHCGCTNYVAS